MQAFNCREKKWEYVEPAPLTDEEIAELQEQAERDVARAKVLERTRPLTAEEVSAMRIAQQINTLTVDDNTALRMREFYPEWAAGVDYGTGFKVQRGGVLYKVLQAHTSQDDWTPDAAPSLFAKVLIPDETVAPEWEQPGSTNQYSAGDKATHNGKTWVSAVDNNVWEPGVYGWTEVST